MYEQEQVVCEDDFTEVSSQHFNRRLAAWMEFLDQAGQLHGYRPEELPGLFLRVELHDRNTALQMLKMRAFFETVAELLEAETGDTAVVLLDRKDDAWRVIVHTGQLVALDLHYRGAHPLQFSSLSGLNNAAEHLITRAIGCWFKKTRSLGRRQVQ